MGRFDLKSYKNVGLQVGISKIIGKTTIVKDVC